MNHIVLMEVNKMSLVLHEMNVILSIIGYVHHGKRKLGRRRSNALKKKNVEPVLLPVGQDIILFVMDYCMIIVKQMKIVMLFLN